MTVLGLHSRPRHALASISIWAVAHPVPELRNIPAFPLLDKVGRKCKILAIACARLTIFEC